MRGVRALVPALAVLAVLLAAAPSAGQEAAADSAPGDRTRAGKLARADSVREAMDRPPRGHPFDALDAVALPFRVAAVPLDLLGDGLARTVVMATRPGPPPFYLVAYRDLRAWGLEPTVTSLDSRSGPAAKLSLVRYEPFFVESAVSWRLSQLHRTGFRLRGERSGAELAAAFQRRAEPHFFGLGPDAPEAQRSDYRWDRYDVSVAGFVRALPWLRLAGEAGWEENQVAPGLDGSVTDLQARFDPAGLFGAGEVTEFLRLAVAAGADGVRWEGFQQRGIRLRVRSAFYDGEGGTEAKFWRLRLEGEGYLPVDGRRQLAFFGRLERNRPVAEPGVPFTHMAAMGDRIGSRGYESDRFRDRDLAALAAEWRYEVWREISDRMRVEAFVFAGRATVSPDLLGGGRTGWRSSFGAGLRLKEQGALLGEAFAAFSREEALRLQLNLERSF